MLEHDVSHVVLGHLLQPLNQVADSAGRLDPLPADELSCDAQHAAFLAVLRAVSPERAARRDVGRQLCPPAVAPGNSMFTAAHVMRSRSVVPNGVANVCRMPYCWSPAAT